MIFDRDMYRRLSQVFGKWSIISLTLPIHPVAWYGSAIVGGILIHLVVSWIWPL